jgi:hypothetical protein
MAAAHHHRMGLAGQRKIAGETAPADDQPRVLLARQWLADEAVAGAVRSGFVVHFGSVAIGHRDRPLLIHRRRREKVGLECCLSEPDFAPFRLK